MGMTPRQLLLHGGAAARAAVHRRRHSRGDGDRRGHGDHRRGDRRRRARRIHLSRAVDGGHDDDSRRRDSRRGARARGRWIALAWLERRIARGAAARSVRRLVTLAVMAALAIAAWSHACGGAHETAIVVGSKNFTEQVVLGELMAQAIEAEGMPVDAQARISAARSSAIARCARATSMSTSNTRAPPSRAVFHQDVPHDPRQGVRAGACSSTRAAA